MSIDWSQYGTGSNQPSPTATVPIAPLVPSSSATYNPDRPWEATQAQVDAMNPSDRIGRGIDVLGNWLFGNKNVEGDRNPVSAVLGQGLKVGGDFIHGAATTVGDLAIANPIKPIEFGASLLSHIPTGAGPGGADETFVKLGEIAKQHDPELYAQWQAVDAATKGDFWSNVNAKGDFNAEALKYIDDQQKDSFLGVSPELAMGRAGSGSVGASLSHAIQGFLGIGGAGVQRFLGGAGITDPGGAFGYEGKYDAAVATGNFTAEEKVVMDKLKAGTITEAEAKTAINSMAGRNRVVESAARLDAGLEVSDVERHAIEAWRSGAWSEDHAQDYIVSHGQGLTRNLAGQIVGSVLTDPLTFATLGAGALSKAGLTAGVEIADTVGQGATLGARLAASATNYEKLGTIVQAVQADPVLGPIARVGRGMIDPLAAYKPSVVERATTNLLSDVAVHSFNAAYGEFAVRDVMAMAREFGMVPEIRGAIASYAWDQANLMVSRETVRSMLDEGLGASLMHTNVDEVIKPLAENASKDAATKLTDHMAQIANNTFTSEERDALSGRMAATFGKDAAYWEKRLAPMGDETKSALHAVVYKRADVGFEKARAAVDATKYTGDAPLSNMALISATTLDDIKAKGIIENITDMLKSDDPEKIASATAEWNAQARQYPAMANIGYAPGGQEQLQQMVRQLEKKLKEGGITKRMTEQELSDPPLRPIRDFLDRNSAQIGETAPPISASAGAQAARKVSQPELDAVRAEGRKLLNQINAEPSSSIRMKPGSAKYKKVTDAAYDSVKDGPYGGMTFDAHTGEPVTVDAMYHGTNPANEASIKASGINRGDWVSDPNSRLIPGDAATRLLYRTTPDNLVGGVEKAAGWKAGPRAAADKLEVSRDGGSTWESVTGGPRTVQGPFTGSVGTQTDMKIIDIGDRAKFNDAFDAFLSANKAQLAKANHQVGIFRNKETGLIEFDVVYSVDDAAKAEAIQMVSPQAQTGGWYNHADGPEGMGIYPPTLSTGRHLWEVGFLPDVEVRWGLGFDHATGLPIVDRDPTISHTVDAVLARQPFSDTTRNVLGQIIGKSKAEVLNRPIDATEAFINTMRDGITGQRLVNNMSRRFEKSTFDAGIPKPISKAIWDKARDIAGLNRTTIRGIAPDNLWDAIHESIPRDLRLADGSTIDVHIVMDHLLRAAEGDLRIMGLTSVMSQRMRNALRSSGLDPANWSGQMTVTMYNRLRYSQPMFLIQRITDAPYYSILYGLAPLGLKALTGAKAELQAITDNLGRTGLARYFSMDMPEFATLSNFTSGIKSAMQDAGLKDNALQRILEAPDTIIANNMTNMLHARLGDMVKGALDNLATAAERADPSMQADMLQAGETLRNSFGEWRQIYSQNAGRILNDNEVGLQYIKDQLNAWRRHVVNADGTLEYEHMIYEGERAMPSSIGEIGPIRPDKMASKELGYENAAALRKDVTGHVEILNGSPVLVRGEHDLPWLEEQLRGLNAHPDYVKRAMAYFSDTWDGFWGRLEQSLEKGGLDISPHYAKEAQAVISQIARERGMDPWEYLSGVMATNIGPEALDTSMGRLVNFLKGGPADASISDWGAFYRSHLDPSAQRVLVDEYAKTAGQAASASTDFAKFESEIPRSAPGKPSRPAVAKLPSAFKHEPGYAYRVETPEAMDSGMPDHLGVTTGSPTAFYDGKDGVQKAIFRIKDEGGILDTGRHGAGGGDRLTTRAVPPEEIEMLMSDGSWQALAADQTGNFFDAGVEDMLKARVASGPHVNPDVEGAIQQIAKLTQRTLQGTEGGTRAHLRELVQAIPTDQAVPFSRTHALVVQLLKDQIRTAQSDIFRLAEMQTKRTLLERSLNHPLFGLYPSSYMWGKVLPETVKFLAKNPYAATYTIANVQRSIAIQREYDHNMDQVVGGVDRSAGAFLLDYLTPGLPWSAQDARMSPLVRGIFNGKDPMALFKAEINTISPLRWIKQVADTMGEIPGAFDAITHTGQNPTENALQGFAGGTGPSAPAQQGPGPVNQQVIDGPTKAAALAPILADDLARLQSMFGPK